ncbi:hypothetical protein K3495_g10615 [Podosphaera aphanis]|nr:hypothetical protein K3495_g10615 [Podosphaera aphanis]
MSTLRIAASQSYTLSSTPATLFALEGIAKSAAEQGIDLLLFPEAYIGGYPQTIIFGPELRTREPERREPYLRYVKEAVDLGDTPEGAGTAWVERLLELPKHGGERGDGTRETLERIARETGVFLVVGLVEKCAGLLYCAVVYVCPNEGIIGKRRKIMPTGSERLVWEQGQPSSLRAITTTIKDVKITLAAAICWENYMPLLRQSLYSQNVSLYLAPTADDRETWLPLMRTIAQEGRCVVISTNQCLTRAHLPSWITGYKSKTPETMPDDYFGTTNTCSPVDWNSTTPLKSRRQSAGTESSFNTVFTDGVLSPPMKLRRELDAEQTFVSRGGACIIGPSGEVLADPLWDQVNGITFVDVDFDDCIRSRLNLDVGGSNSRNDHFRLIVEGLDLTPPP